MGYHSINAYLQTASTIKDKITKIDSLIVAMEDAAMRAAEGQDVSSYTLNDGHTQISATNRNATEILASIDALEKMRQRYVNRLRGRVTRLTDRNSHKIL